MLASRITHTHSGASRVGYISILGNPVNGGDPEGGVDRDTAEGAAARTRRRTRSGPVTAPPPLVPPPSSIRYGRRSWAPSRSSGQGGGHWRRIGCYAMAPPDGRSAERPRARGAPIQARRTRAPGRGSTGGDVSHAVGVGVAPEHEVGDHVRRERDRRRCQDHRRQEGQ